MKIAIITIGGIETKKNIGEKNLLQREYNNTAEFIYPCKYSFDKHIVNVNKNHTFDFYLSNWVININNENTIKNTQNMINIYNPIDYNFQNYKNISREQSYVLSMKYGLNIALKKYNYEYIFFIRPDVLIWKDINISEINYNLIYRNNGVAHAGDFIFYMNLNNAIKFVEKPGINTGLSGYIEDKTLLREYLVAGEDIELYYKNFKEKFLYNKNLILNEINSNLLHDS